MGMKFFAAFGRFLVYPPIPLIPISPFIGNYQAAYPYETAPWTLCVSVSLCLCGKPSFAAPAHQPGHSVTEIYVDADACPVKDEVLRVAARHGLAVHYVSNQWMRLPESPLVNRVVVDDGFDAADDWIAENAGPGDIAITADILLAARCLEAGAAALGHNGKPFTPENIGAAVAMRELKSHLRETGEISGAGPSFSKADRSNFLQALEAAVRAASRAG